MTTLADVLQPLDETIPSSLVSSTSLAAIAATVQDLPSELTHHFGFECALGDDAPTADFALAINSQDGEDALLGSEPLPARSHGSRGMCPRSAGGTPAVTGLAIDERRVTR